MGHPPDPAAYGQSATGLRGHEPGKRRQLPEGQGGRATPVHHLRGDIPTPFPDDTKEGGRGVRGAGYTTPGPRAEVAVGVRVGGGSHREDRGGAAGQHAAVRPSNMVIRKEACTERVSGKAGRRLCASKTASETDTQRPEGGWGWRWARQAQMSQVRWRGAF